MAGSLFRTKSIDKLLVDASASGETTLKRTLGPSALVALGIGAIIGAGLFVRTAAAIAERSGPSVTIALPLSASSIDLDFDVGVDNPNPVGIRLDRLDFDVLVNDNPVLTQVHTPQGVHIPARGIGQVHLVTRVTYRDIRNIWSQITDVINGNRATYQVRGNAYYDTPIGSMRFPVTVYSR